MRTILLIAPLGFGLVACNREPPKFTQEEVTQSLALLVRESEKGKLRFAALDAVRDSAPFVSEFVRLFPGAEVNYRYFSTPDEPGFDVEVDLHERYSLTMQLPVRFDLERRKVVGYGEPNFYLTEATNHTGRMTSYDPAGGLQFGSASWRTLLDKRGDFSSIGYVMRTNQPVSGFKDRKLWR